MSSENSPKRQCKSLEADEIYKRLVYDNEITHPKKFDVPNYKIIYYNRETEVVRVIGNTKDGISPDAVEELCSVSTYGDLKTKTTVIDKTVRDSLEIPAKYILFDTGKNVRSATISSDFLDDVFDKETIKIVPYKLVLYKKGHFFNDHVDACEGTDFVGSLVLGLSGGYSGGVLTVKQNFLVRRHSLGVGDTVFFYGNCLHSVSEVTDGNRIVMLYKVFTKNQQSGFTERKLAGATFERKIEHLIDSLPRGYNHFFQTFHHYACDKNDDQEYVISALKGSDCKFYDTLKNKHAHEVKVTMVPMQDQKTFLVDSDTCTSEFDGAEVCSDYRDHSYDDFVYSKSIVAYTSEDNWDKDGQAEYHGHAGNEASHYTQPYYAWFFRVYRPNSNPDRPFTYSEASESEASDSE